MFDGFLPASKLKKKTNITQSQPVWNGIRYGVCQPAVAQASYEQASKVSFNTLPRKTYRSVGKICFTSNLHEIKEKRI